MEQFPKDILYSLHRTMQQTFIKLLLGSKLEARCSISRYLSHFLILEGSAMNRVNMQRITIT